MRKRRSFTEWRVLGLTITRTRRDTTGSHHTTVAVGERAIVRASIEFPILCVLRWHRWSVEAAGESRDYGRIRRDIYHCVRRQRPSGGQCAAEHIVELPPKEGAAIMRVAR